MFCSIKVRLNGISLVGYSTQNVLMTLNPVSDDKTVLYRVKQSLKKRDFIFLSNLQTQL